LSKSSQEHPDFTEIEQAKRALYMKIILPALSSSRQLALFSYPD